MDAPAAEAALRARLGFELEARLATLGAEFGGLIDRPTLVLLLADDEGLLPRPAGAEPAMPSAFQEVRGTLERLTPTRTFRRGDGTIGFVCDAELRTEEGLQRIVLWDDAVRKVQGWLGKPVRVTALTPKAKNGTRELQSTRATWIGAP